jgi:hypothetical protein
LSNLAISACVASDDGVEMMCGPARPASHVECEDVEQPVSVGSRGNEGRERQVLLSYAPNFAEFYGRAAEQVSRILKGAKPAEMPGEQPTKFELFVNLKTAKALGC